MTQNDPAYAGGGRPSGYARRWPKWVAIYAVAAAAIYLIVYFVFLHHGGGYSGGGSSGGGSGGGGSGGGGGGYAVVPLPTFLVRRIIGRRTA
jgi:hypothetical protein